MLVMARPNEGVVFTIVASNEAPKGVSKFKIDADVSDDDVASIFHYAMGELGSDLKIIVMLGDAIIRNYDGKYSTGIQTSGYMIAAVATEYFDEVSAFLDWSIKSKGVTAEVKRREIRRIIGFVRAQADKLVETIERLIAKSKPNELSSLKGRYRDSHNPINGADLLRQVGQNISLKTSHIVVFFQALLDKKKDSGNTPPTDVRSRPSTLRKPQDGEGKSVAGEPMTLADVKTPTTGSDQAREKAGPDQGVITCAADLGAQFKAARTNKGISQETLAEDVGITSKQVSNIENGRSFPTFETAIKMGRRLGFQVRITL